METPTAFAPLSKRIAALLFDSVFMAFYFALTLLLIRSLTLSSGKLESLLVIGICLSIEPFLLAFSGATLGQHLLKIKVRKLAEDEKLSLLQAYWRSATKIVFGFLSLITVLSSRRYQAVHDMLVSSIVVLTPKGVSKASYRLSERSEQTELYDYPPAWRRIAMMFVYILLLFIVLSISTYFSFSDACLDDNRCSLREEMLNFLLSTSFWVALFVLVSRCWIGRMPGCRRILRE
ncbi:RDD family protein [Pseudoteredinibacter isoporae]|uniref:RDD family protein n=1 Tax=Pseudoteredinibacter isoporae TaxID=570281 RepID=UPI00310A9CB8